MKFSVNQQDLQKALNYCQGVIEKRSTLPILSNILYFILPLDAVLILINIVLSIIGFVKVTNNQHWEYPLAISFFKK